MARGHVGHVRHHGLAIGALQDEQAHIRDAHHLEDDAVHSGVESVFPEAAQVDEVADAHPENRPRVSALMHTGVAQRVPLLGDRQLIQGVRNRNSNYLHPAEQVGDDLLRIIHVEHTGQGRLRKGR